MIQRYQPLSFHSMPGGAGYARPLPPAPAPLSLDDPALAAMTDLRRQTALTVERTNTLAATRERMSKLGVRMLLVTDATAAVMGVVTLTDLDSDRPAKIATKTGEQPESLMVQDIMTLRGRIEVLRLSDVSAACVGQMVSSLLEAGRRHALVLCEADTISPPMVCGVFSLTRLCSQVGLDVKPGDGLDVVHAALAEVLP